MVLGIFRQVGIDLDTTATEPTVTAAPATPRKRGIYYAD